MDNVNIADGVIVLLLLLGLWRGAKRGLVGSILGVVVVVGALLGALTVSDMLTDPITDYFSERVEEQVVLRVSTELKRIQNGTASKGGETLTELFERYDIPTELLDEMLQNASDILAGAKSFTSQEIMERFTDAASSGVRAIVHGAVRTVVTLGAFLVLLLVLGLVGKAVDKVFDLPLLDTTNALGGAIFGLAGAAIAVYALLYLATRFNITAILNYEDGSRLMPIFMPRSTVGLAETLYG